MEKSFFFLLSLETRLPGIIERHASKDGLNVVEAEGELKAFDQNTVALTQLQHFFSD